MLKKFLSRKLLIAIITGVVDILILTGSVDPAVKPLVLQLITALGGLYIAIEGIADIISRIKSVLNPTP